MFCFIMNDFCVIRIKTAVTARFKYRFYVTFFSAKVYLAFHCYKVGKIYQFQAFVRVKLQLDKNPIHEEPDA